MKKCNQCGAVWADSVNFCGFSLNEPITITLDSQVARWLMGYTQNPPWPNETAEDIRNREIVWDILKAAGVSV